MSRLYYNGAILRVSVEDKQKLCKLVKKHYCTDKELVEEINLIPAKHQRDLKSFERVQVIDLDFHNIPAYLAEKDIQRGLDFWSPEVIGKYYQVTGEDQGAVAISDESDTLTESDNSSILSSTPQGTAQRKQPQTPPKPSVAPRSGNMSGIDIAAVVQQAIDNLFEIDINLFNYEGFDPIKIRELVLHAGSKKKKATFKIGSKQMHFHEDFVYNDLNFLVTLGLMRGNKLGKISDKSSKELQAILANMISTYNLVEKAGKSSTSITLMRIVNSFPDIAYDILKAGRGRDVASIGLSKVLCNSVSFQKVSKKSFKVYALHFLYVNQKIDRVINKQTKNSEAKFTDLKDLWNYMVLAYNSPVIPEGKRIDDIGEPMVVEQRHMIIGNEGEIWTRIVQKVNSNDISVL